MGAGMTITRTPVARATALDARAGMRHGIPILLCYLTALAFVAFWPVPVDRGASGLLRAISRAVPLLTYDVIESLANVAMFVPFGVLLALMLPARRAWVVPIALAASLAMEAGQALFLPARTSSVADVVANVGGAAIGLAVVWIIEQRGPSR